MTTSTTSWRATIFQAYRRSIKNGRTRREPEHERRDAALLWLSELLDGRPLDGFSVAQLDLQELLLSYWLQLCEITKDAPLVAQPGRVH